MADAGIDHPSPRVLLVHANAEWYGSDRSFVALACGLQARGCNVRAVVPGPGRVADKLADGGVTVVLDDPGVPRPRAWSPLRLLRWAVLELPRSIAKMRGHASRADVVHLNTSTVLGGLVGAALARRPIVLHLREYHPASSRAWRAYVRLVRPVVSRVIAISSDIATDAQDAGFGAKVRLVHNGLPFAAGATGDHEHRLLTVGRINAWKGHEVLVDAVARARARGIEIEAWIAGDPYPGDEHLVRELEARIQDRGVADLVHLLGYVDDIPRLHRGASVFVSSTTRPEPFGLALVEAMADGLAAVASNAGGPRDIVRSGETGLLVPMGDDEALAEALVSLATDPAGTARMGAAAASDVRERFHVDKTVDGVLAVYDELR